MRQLNRRDMLAVGAGAAALAAMPPLPMPAFAAAPPAGKQTPGFYRYKLGSFEVTAVTDGMQQVPLTDNFVRNAKKDDLDAALKASHYETGHLKNPYTPAVINTGSKLIAIDTGAGPTVYGRTKGLAGQYQTNLAASGIDVKAIDTVLISHFHGDHINGLLDADSKPIFVNAELMVPATEWAFWMDDGNMSRAPEAAKAAFQNVRRVFGVFGNKVTQYADGKEIVPGLTSLPTPGHTPGHTSVLVSSGSSTLLVQGDVALMPAMFLRNPGWHVMYDMDGPVAEQTRRKLYDRLSVDGTMVQGYHFPFPSTGYIEKAGSGYRLEPVAWNPNP